MSDSPIKILLVEDNPGDTRLIREALADGLRNAYEVEDIDRLGAALERIERGGIDVVLLDLTLPDSRGIETFAAVYARASEIPIIVLTGLGDELLAARTVHGGAQDYLVKGQADANLLARSIRYAIERHHVRRELRASEQQLKSVLAEIRSLNEDLERRVAERTGELAAANRDLEAFTYSVSHDLRAPLRQVDGFVQILVEELGDTLEPAPRHHLDRIKHGAHHMGRLVDDLLHLAQLGRQDLRPQATRLDQVVKAVVADLATELAGRRVEWRLGALPTVACDPGLIRVVYTNLLSNAVKYSRPRAHAVIDIGETTRDGTPVLFVKDNGVGFDMKYSDKLFGVFQRLHRSEDFDGTGVGLATVQRIVHKHGGRIWAEAEPDRGATFYFTLGLGGRAA
ncbi:MAG: hybrid sensor histidine kinase/response regulator [Gemmatimonadetes bacterium]|nr:MAG: hybrid sensor histidine kinase/response regulator [Gemmatimonadota bacterium]